MNQQKIIEAIKESAIIRNCHTCGSRFEVCHVFLTDNTLNYCFHICINCWKTRYPNTVPTPSPTCVVVEDAWALKEEMEQFLTAAQQELKYDSTQGMQ